MSNPGYNPAERKLAVELPLSIATPGYAIHCLAHLVCLPYLIANGIVRALRGRYRGIALTRLTGGGPPERAQGAVVFVGTALGETRTAFRAAHRLMADRAVGAAVWLETMEVVEVARRSPGKAHATVAPFNNPISALVGLLRWRPAGLVFIESARSMHLVMMARLLGIPTVLANVKLSEARAERHRKRWLGAWRYQAMGLIAAQSENHARRLEAIGVPKEMISVSGPDFGAMMSSAERLAATSAWRQTLHAEGAGTPVIVAGSTYEPEERIVLRAFEAFRRNYPDAILLLAPRRTWRRGGADSTLRLLSLDYELRSRLNDKPLPKSGIVLLDTQGELQDAYAAATAAFVGGTLVPGVGGHSPIEPLVWGVPVTLGPNFAHQEAVVSAVVQSDFVRVCRTADELSSRWCEWANGDRPTNIVERISELFATHDAVYQAWHDLVRSPRRRRGIKPLRNDPIEHP